ncbi:MAG: hypothetical protein FWF52_08245 [Candidatus Azobacteroides sp.]|nr:hypothetical protein [Candidatus Azobacteroides sp.]
MKEKIDQEGKETKMKYLPEIFLGNEGKIKDFNFQPIYELGRLLTKGGNTEFEWCDLEKIECPPNIKEDVSHFFYRVAENILNENLHFHPLLIDFLVFDPEDERGERFHTAICSISTEVIKRYLKETKIDIEENTDAIDENGQDVRSMLSDQYLYKSPFFYYYSENWKKENSFFHLLKSPENAETNHRVHIFFGSFKIKRNQTMPLSNPKKHIEALFDRMDKKLLQDEKGLIKINCKEIAEKKYAFNTCGLIPLLRPDSSLAGDSDFRLRGGGVFLYGHTASDDHPVEIFAQLQYFFSKIILRERPARTPFDYLRHDYANHYIHDFKTFLSSEFTEKIKRVVKRNQLSEQDHNELNEVIYGADLFKRYLTNILEAYRDFIIDKGQKNHYCASDLKKLLNALNSEFANQLQVNFIDEVCDDNQIIKVNGVIMEKIFRNLYTNTITEYQKQNIPFQEREASVKWYASMNQTNDYPIITIAYFNRNLKFNNALIKSFGIKPIGDTDVLSTSTGLGGYFINNTLSWMDAEDNALPHEVKTIPRRYIRVENINEGEIFTFKFKLLNK